MADRRGVTVLPHGSGKTASGDCGHHPPACCRPSALVPTRVLLDQWARAIHELHGVLRARAGWAMASTKSSPITVATFEKRLAADAPTRQPGFSS